MFNLEIKDGQLDCENQSPSPTPASPAPAAFETLAAYNHGNTWRPCARRGLERSCRHVCRLPRNHLKFSGKWPPITAFNKMARIDPITSNELFEVLADWNVILTHSWPDDPQVSP